MYEEFNIDGEPEWPSEGACLRYIMINRRRRVRRHG